MTEPTDEQRERATELVLAKWPGSGPSSIEVAACAIGLADRAEVEALKTALRESCAAWEGLHESGLKGAISSGGLNRSMQYKVAGWRTLAGWGE